MLRTCSQPRVLILALALAACSAEDGSPTVDAELPVHDVSPAAADARVGTDAATADGSLSGVDGGTDDGGVGNPSVADASSDDARTRPIEGGSLTDAAVSPLASDAASLAMDAGTAPATVPTPAEVYAILDRRCGQGCHNNQGSTGWLFDGRLRNTLFGAVEAPVVADAGPTANDCRRERRIVRGDPNSYFIRKIELWFGRTPKPSVCGAGMPLDLIFDDKDRRQFPLELERLKLWIANGAPLQ